MKKITFIGIILFLVSCTNSVNKEIPTELSEFKTTETCLPGLIDFQRYQTISMEVLSKVAESDMTESEITRLVMSEDYDSIYYRISANQADIERFDSLSIYASNLASIYSTSSGDCSLCSYSQSELAQSFVSVIGWVRSNPDDFNDFELICDTGGGTQCQWVPYVACLAACCTLPPIINALCCLACYCEFCVREPGHPMNEPCGQAAPTGGSN